jgi:hypothetical protein
VGGDEKYQLRIVDKMIAMTDDGWKTAKLAIGLFSSKDTGTQWGVNAEMLAGNLIIGNNLVIETEDGSFSVDSSGVHIDSLKFYITHGNSADTTLSGELSDLSDQITSGDSALSSQISGVNSTLTNKINSVNSSLTNSVNSVSDQLSTVSSNLSKVANLNSGYLYASTLSGVISATAAQMKSSKGNVLFDSDGIWLMNSAYKSSATKAVWMNENGILLGSGSKTSDPGSNWSWTTAITADGIVANAIASSGTLSGVNIKGGTLNIGNGNCTISESGTLKAVNGEFSGIISGTLKGTLSADSSGGEISGCSINVNNKKFYVDSSGNVTMKGNLELGSGVITWGNLDSNTQGKLSAADDIANGTYSGGSFISNKEIYSPTIYTEHLNIYPANKASSGSYKGGFSLYGYYGSSLKEVLRIVYEKSNFNVDVVKFTTSDASAALWSFIHTYFEGTLDFTRATKVVFDSSKISGISSTATFG